VSPWQSPGQYGESSRPMAAFSAFFLKAQDLLLQAMPEVLHHRTAMAIEMACKEGAFIRCRHLF